MKKRLDLLVTQRFPQYSRTYIQSVIMQGKVQVDGVPVTKAGAPTAEAADIVIDDVVPQFVCRAGLKLEKALDHFEIDVTGLMVLDAGLSTGGFTDCLLQRGAQKVFGIDVGYGQVADAIRNDPRVVVMERTNLRYLNTVGQSVDLVTLDLSFISVAKVLDAVCRVLKADGRLIVLIKPQFEARKEQVGKGGVITDGAVHREVIERVSGAIQMQGFSIVGVTESPITGAMGNVEFLLYAQRTMHTAEHGE